MHTFTITPRGAFSLRESATFGFGQRDGVASYDGAMRLACCLDGGFATQVGVVVRERDGVVTGEVHGHELTETDVARAEAQVSRVLSLDHDERAFAEVGRADPVLRALQVAAPGLRPPLFYSPYEAAVWSVLSARRPGRQMARVRAALSKAAGASFDLAGERLSALPTPEALLRVDAFPGVEPERLERMKGVAHFAADGRLEAARLHALGPDEAHREVQKIKGIGPTYASLIVIRAVGFTDIHPRQEPKALALIGALYGLPGPAEPEQFDRIAGAWTPWRTWASVYVRAVGPRLLAQRAQAA